MIRAEQRDGVAVGFALLALWQGKSHNNKKGG